MFPQALAGVILVTLWGVVIGQWWGPMRGQRAAGFLAWDYVELGKVLLPLKTSQALKSHTYRFLAAFMARPWACESWERFYVHFLWDWVLIYRQCVGLTS